MTFFSHALLGAAGMTLAVPEHPVLAAVVGGIEGALPDVLEWIDRLRGGTGMKERTHTGDLVWLGFLMPPWLWHVGLDFWIFHATGTKLYEQRGWIEAVIVVACLDILMVSFL